MHVHYVRFDESVRVGVGGFVCVCPEGSPFIVPNSNHLRHVANVSCHVFYVCMFITPFNKYGKHVLNVPIAK